jgi:hypothetical protein
MISELLAEGCILDIQEDGENGPVVTFNMEVLELKYPDVAEVAKQEQLQEIDDALSNLVDLGLVEMGFMPTEDGGIEAVYSLTEMGKKYAENLLT